MNYNQIRSRATAGIKFFSDGDGTFRMTRGDGKVTIVNGQEVVNTPEEFTIKGAVRDINDRDINGETILAGDKRGFFTYDVEILKGDVIYVDGEAYRVTNARPVKPTGTVVAYRPVIRRVAVG